MVKTRVKKLFKGIKITVSIALILFLIMSYILYSMPTGGKLLYTTDSPSGIYVIEVYHHPNSLSPNGVRCRVKAKYGIIGRNIYWCFPKDNVTVTWNSETEVNIDGVVLNVLWGRYDCRI